MGNLTSNFNRLALYLAYKAGHLTWQQLPLTTQSQCIKAGAQAAHVAYGKRLAAAPKAWCQATMAATGGTHLTNYALPTVANSTAPTTKAATANYRKAG